MQKTDTGKIYAMKTLKKEEMLKKDQVSGFLEFTTHITEIDDSWHMSVLNVTY